MISIEVLEFYTTSGKPLRFASPPTRKPVMTKPERKRKPSMADATRLSKRDGVKVEIAPDGTVIVTPVKPLDNTPTDDTETGNEWDKLQ